MEQIAILNNFNKKKFIKIIHYFDLYNNKIQSDLRIQYVFPITIIKIQQHANTECVKFKVQR